MHRRFSNVGLVAIAAGFVLSVVVAPLAVAAPTFSPHTLSVAAPDSWAYGAERWFNLTTSTPAGVHTISAYMAFYAVFERTNVSSTVTQLSVDRTAYSNFTSSYCSPDCTSPRISVVVEHESYLHALGFVNLTRDGTVYEDGVAVPAIAVLDAAAQATGTLRSTANVTVVTPQGTNHAEEAFSASGQAALALGLSPALGLVPTALNVGDTWNATSQYTGSGSWSVGWTYTKLSANGSTISLSGTPSGALNQSGNVSVEGAVVASMTLPDGTVLPAVVLSFDSDLDVLDGLILLPHGMGLFDGGSAPWGGYQLGAVAMETHRLAVQFSGDFTSFRLRAASAFYGTSDAAVASGQAGSPNLVVTPTTSLSTGVPSVEVTAVPMSVTDATTAGDCLATGTCTGGGTTTSSSPLPWLWIEVGVGVAVVGAAVVVTALWLRRRPAP